MINREILLEKLTGYLDGTISKEEAYGWALGIAVSAEFERVAKEDALIGRAVRDLIDINHADLAAVPGRKAFEYYQKCLLGKMEFKLKGIDVQKLEAFDNPEQVVVKKKRKNNIKQVLIICRVYIVIFCLCSLVMHGISVVKPDFLRFEDSIPSRAETIKESLPHLLYAFVVLLPVGFTAKGLLFFVTFPVLVVGMFYYWYISVALVTKLSLNIIFAFVLLPFSAIPATLALVMLVMRRNSIKKEMNV